MTSGKFSADKTNDNLNHKIYLTKKMIRGQITLKH